MQKETIWDTVVIGGGPAGMMAAGRAAERGRRVLLLEKNSGLGKKLLITGGGRCNVTNNKPDVRTMLAKYKNSDKYLFSAFTQFGVMETLDFFHDRGVNTKEENEGRMFPTSNTARSVWDVLVKYMRDGGVKIKTNADVSDISQDKATEHMIIALANGQKLRARACIIATGGISHPETGSTGEGFKWIKKLGHTIAENDLALVPVTLKNAWIKKLAGVTLKDVKLTTYKDNIKQKIYKGDLLFTHVGISGPTVLNMSRAVGDLLARDEGSEYIANKKKKDTDVTIMLDLFPMLNIGALNKKLQALLIGESNKKIKNALSSLIPSTLIEVVLKLANINSDTPNHSVHTEERKALIDVLKAIPLSVNGLLGKDKAVISSGGVALNEVNFKTMQSRIVPQLYLVGDVLNIDRPSGGYSLQLCWTTGYVAGDHC